MKAIIFQSLQLSQGCAEGINLVPPDLTQLVWIVFFLCRAADVCVLWRE